MAVQPGRRAPALLVLILNLGWFGILAALALTICLAVASPFIDVSGGELSVPVSFRLDEQRFGVSSPALGVRNARINEATGTLTFVPGDKRSLVAPMVALVCMLAVALWILGELRALFRTVRDGHPFVAANAARLRRIGWAMIAWQPVYALMVFGANRFAADTFVAGGLRFDTRFDMNGGAIVSGLIVLAIAEAFRIGTRLDEDQSLTI
jgi:hypothetical protein